MYIQVKRNFIIIAMKRYNLDLVVIFIENNR